MQIKSLEYQWNRNFPVNTIVIVLRSITFWLIVPSVFRIQKCKNCGVKGVCHSPAPRQWQSAKDTTEARSRCLSPTSSHNASTKTRLLRSEIQKVTRLIFQSNQVVRSVANRLHELDRKGRPDKLEEGPLIQQQWICRDFQIWVSVQSPELWRESRWQQG